MHKVQLVLLLLSLSISNLASSQSLESKVDNLYQVSKDEPGFSISVFKDTKIILEKQYGSANLDYNIPITNETVFDIGSIAKQFTAAAILLLEKEGKLSIKEPAYKYIDNLPRYKKGDPTVEQLLNQTSGIQEVDPYLYLIDLDFYDLLTQSQMVNIITKVKDLNFYPGDYFQYTNANYILLAEIIKKTSGKPFQEYLQDHIFSPLGMANTIKKSSTYTNIKNAAIGYIKEDGQYYKAHLHTTIYNGDGQISTTPRDMFKWHQGIKNALIGTPQLWNKMQTKARLNNGTPINYGLGVEFTTHNGYEAFGFDGMIIGGFVSKYLYFPELDLAFFTTQNTFEPDFRERFFQLVDLFIPQKESLDKAVQIHKHNKAKLSNKQLKAFEGHYIFLGNEREPVKSSSIKLKNETLVVYTLDGEEIGKLEPLGNQKFLFHNKVLQFNIDATPKQYHYFDEEHELPWTFNEFEPYSHSQNELKTFEGHYYNKEFQIGKKITLEKDTLNLYFRNGAWNVKLNSRSKNLLEIAGYPVEILKHKDGTIDGVKIMGLVFKKLITQ